MNNYLVNVKTFYLNSCQNLQSKAMRYEKTLFLTIYENIHLLNIDE